MIGVYVGYVVLVLFWYWYLERGVKNADIVDVPESEERDLL
jgi:high-affinity Fe2+/Pb2+ permease